MQKDTDIPLIVVIIPRLRRVGLMANDVEQRAEYLGISRVVLNL